MLNVQQRRETFVMVAHVYMKDNMTRRGRLKPKNCRNMSCSVSGYGNCCEKTSANHIIDQLVTYTCIYTYIYMYIQWFPHAEA